jgi:uncharacterized protein (DUF2141 family)
VLAFLLGFTGIEAVHAADLAVSVTGVRSDQGLIRICLTAEAEKADFPDCHHAPPARRSVVKAQAGTVQAVFHDIPAGTWAVAAFHDLDGDGVLKTNLFGTPREGVGASRDPRGLFGPPRFDKAAFRVGPEGAAIALALMYP